MKKRKKVAMQQQIEWLKKKVLRLEENSIQLKNKVYTESYFWKHDKKELLNEIISLTDTLKKRLKTDKIFTIVQFITNLLVCFWIGWWLSNLIITLWGMWLC